MQIQSLTTISVYDLGLYLKLVSTYTRDAAVCPAPKEGV